MAWLLNFKGKLFCERKNVASSHSGSNPGKVNVHYSGLKKTRWLAGKFRAINALERHFLTTIMHLQHKSQTKGDDGAKAKGILQNLQSERFVKFMYFLLDVMKVLSDLSKSLQRDEFCITNFLLHLKSGISQLDVLRVQRGILKASNVIKWLIN